jgi:hypothetical protein
MPTILDNQLTNVMSNLIEFNLAADFRHAFAGVGP